MASPFNPFASGANPGSSPVGATDVGAPPSGDAGAFEVAKPPVVLLGVAAGIGVLGIILGALGFGSWLASAGWVAAGPVAIGTLALFVYRDTARRALPTYLSPDGIGFLYAGVVLVVVAGIVVSALGFAWWVGHR